MKNMYQQIILTIIAVLILLVFLELRNKRLSLELEKEEEKERYNADVKLEDKFVAEAKKIIIESGKASTSYLQRRMRIGYSKAARIIDILEEEGVLESSEGANKGRVILVKE